MPTSSLNLRVDLDKFVGASDLERVVLDIFSGDDTIKGSSGDDILTGGKGSDRLFGKAGDDELYGQKGKDLLDGGEGSDTLDGGGGKDTYVFSGAPGSDLDTIVAFQAGETIEVSSSSFAGLTVGQLAVSQFFAGSEAQDGDDRFIYDPATGALYHDADGAGGQGQTQFAQLEAELSEFGAGNILVV